MIVNHLAIDCHGIAKEFKLVLSNISSVPADLHVASTHTYKGRFHGKVIQDLETIHGHNFWKNGKEIFLFTPENAFNTYSQKIKASDRVTTPQILYYPTDSDAIKKSDVIITRMHSPQLYSNFDEANIDFSKNIKNIFLAIATLEYAGRDYNTIALPLLGGQRDFNRHLIMHTLLDESIKWLNFSRHTNSIVFCVVDEHEASIWSEVMNTVLRRNMDSLEDSILIQALKKQLDQYITLFTQKHVSKHLSDVLHHLQQDLFRERVYVHHFGMHGRKMVEVISREICKNLGIQESTNPFKNIEEIEKTRRIAKWISSCLHSLRILGNESVHVLESDYTYPRSLEGNDLYVILSNMCRVLQFYIDYLNQADQHSV